ncbi:MAG: hypothetical protein LQ350_003766 [Teloschistes chrysophthalmus]|nr:MAG: hypothetical protein LQ350_003766 [Niorma chrysophthalma]
MLSPYFVLPWCLLNVLVTALVPPPAAPGTDACGPFEHQNDAGFSTCTSAVVPGGPAPYGIVCGHDDSITVQVRQNTCARSAKYMCYWLVTGSLNAGEWHWTADDDLTDCRAGIFLSAQLGAAPKPNYRRCLNQIFQPLVMSCVTSKYNVGTVNIRALPDYTKNDTGQTVNAGYHAYIISPMALYYSKIPFATPGVFGSPSAGVAGIGNQTNRGEAAAAASSGNETAAAVQGVVSASVSQPAASTAAGISNVASENQGVSGGGSGTGGVSNTGASRDDHSGQNGGGQQPTVENLEKRSLLDTWASGLY